MQPFGRSPWSKRWMAWIFYSHVGQCLITGKNHNEDLCNVEEVLQIKVLKRKNAGDLWSSIISYGLCISKEEVSPTKERLEAIQNSPQPSSTTELCSFLRLLAALSSFISILSEPAHPLNDLLGNKPWEWIGNCENSFQQLKKIVTTDTVLAYYMTPRKIRIGCGCLTVRFRGYHYACDSWRQTQTNNFCIKKGYIKLIKKHWLSC